MLVWIQAKIGPKGAKKHPCLAKGNAGMPNKNRRSHPRGSRRHYCRSPFPFPPPLHLLGDDICNSIPNRSPPVKGKCGAAGCSGEQREGITGRGSDWLFLRGTQEQKENIGKKYLSAYLYVAKGKKAMYNYAKNSALSTAAHREEWRLYIC